jgi:hypothetical protein
MRGILKSLMAGLIDFRGSWSEVAGLRPHRRPLLRPLKSRVWKLDRLAARG